MAWLIQYRSWINQRLSLPNTYPERPNEGTNPLIYIKQLRGDKLSRLEYRASEALLERGTKKSKNSILTTAIGRRAVGNLWTYLLGRTSCCGKSLNVSAGPDVLLRETSEFICWAGVKPYVGFNLEFFFIDWAGLDAVFGAFQVRITHRVWLCCRASMCCEDFAYVSSLLVLALPNMPTWSITEFILHDEYMTVINSLTIFYVLFPTRKNFFSKIIAILLVNFASNLY